MITSIKAFENGNNLTIRTDMEGTKDCSQVCCEFTHTPSEEDKSVAKKIVAGILEGCGWNKPFTVKWIS